MCAICKKNIIRVKATTTVDKKSRKGKVKDKLNEISNGFVELNYMDNIVIERNVPQIKPL